MCEHWSTKVTYTVTLRRHIDKAVRESTINKEPNAATAAICIAVLPPQLPPVMINIRESPFK